MLSLFFPRSIRHFPNCRRKQTKTEILFSYLIIFEVNNRFVIFSIDKNFQKSTEIGSRFHNPPTAGCPNSLLLPAGLYHPTTSNLPLPASSLSFSLRPPLPTCSPSVSLPPRPPTRFFSPPAYITPPCPPTCPASFCISLSAYPASAISFSLQSSSLPVSRLFLSQPLFSLSSRRPTYTAVFLTRLPFPITLPSPYPPAAYLASLPSVSLLPRPYSSEVTAAAYQPPLFSLRRPFRRSFSLSDKLFTIKKDVPKARLFLQAFFYSLHSSSAAKTSGLQPNTSCQIPRILRPHQTSVRINMRLPENIICR